MTLELPALKGTNPLGLFAALGVLDATTRAARADGAPLPRLWWTDDLEPEARLEGCNTIDDLVTVLDQDRTGWTGSAVLEPTVDGELQVDVKLSTNDPKRGGRNLLREWIEHVHGAEGPGQAERDRDVAMLQALVAEGSTMGTSDDAKPTHLHFTAGQQKFLAMVRDLRDQVTTDRLVEALVGPWRFDSPLPMLGWDTSRGDRIYALRGFNPAGEKKLGVPGAEWLGFVGLRFFPVATQVVRGRAQLVTTGCAAPWKQGSFSWPLWGAGSGANHGLPASVVQSVLADTKMANLSARDRASLGVHRLLRAPIARSDQGGYGSFGPPTEVVTSSEQITAMVL